MPKENPNLYEINTAAWLYYISQKLGQRITLGNIPESEWDRLKELGMDFVWLMGVWKRSQAGRKIFQNEPYFPDLMQKVLPDWKEDDIIGSAYSVVEYSPDPLVGGWPDVDQARSELNRRGIGLVLDFVANHTAVDCSWTNTHPEFYVQGDRKDYERDSNSFQPVKIKDGTFYLAHGRDPNFPSWTDTLQLNYFNTGLRQAVIAQIKEISGHCDGLRCDMAMLLLNDVFRNTWNRMLRKEDYQSHAGEFWSEAIATIPDFTWIAEAYWDTGNILLDLGFDYVYDKKLYDHLRHSSASDIESYLKTGFDFQKSIVRFIENHDEPRSTEVFPRGRLMAAATLIATLPGMKLYHQGQFEGKRIRLPVQLRRSREETDDFNLLDFYVKLLTITCQEAFHGGHWSLKTVRPAPQGNRCDNLLAYIWRLKDELRLVVVNFGVPLAQGLISLEGEVNPHRHYLLFDELDGQRYSRWGGDMAGPGLHVILEDYRAHIFKIMPG